jgi:bifunctional non-homologous end joining protein LigD
VNARLARHAILASVVSRASTMQPTLVREPFHRPGWVYEETYDGWRMLAFKDGERVRLVSRQGVDHTERFHSIAAAVCRLPAERLILDGEVCSFDENLISQFQYLPTPPPEVHATPPVFMAFDCLENGRDLRAEPLAHRRDALECAIDAGALMFAARRLPPHGLDAWATVKESGYEGLVAKDEQSPYRGGLTRWWLKMKVRYEGVFLVGGILGTPDAWEGLLVGERVGRCLLYRGAVEWGVRRGVLADLLERSRVVLHSPFHDGPDTRRATWLEPCVRVELTYNELMEGRLRDPVLRSMR